MRVLSLFLSLIPVTLFSKDCGRFGTVFPITEKDMVDDIKERLSLAKKDGRLQDFQRALKKELKESVTRPRDVSFLKPAIDDRVFSVDPSIILESDIRVPRDDGSVVTLGRKGDRINPLNYKGFDTPLFFLDGDNEAHRDYAKELTLKNPNVKCLLIKGTPGFDTKRGVFFYFDQSGVYSKRFSIKAYPSFVTQKPNERVLTVHEMSLDEKNNTEGETL